VSASADSQERWRRFYDGAAPTNRDRDYAGELIQKAESRVFWQTAFVVGSTILLGTLFGVFYTILSR
jgi:hypothetical protein